ncbi:hypothetical protein KUTeg_003260 [Tegillarca granosa]|uniref:EF-hand domain-containing protein n=1 Tax=Tegillarca granosa TaxID=220873 RepID=A0ABQ9FLL9_TEGGR|nr:hypothetical protein KUTeg_003260 [Tegillarca granosa]
MFSQTTSNRAEVGSRMESRASSRLSNASAQARLEVDELPFLSIKNDPMANFSWHKKTNIHQLLHQNIDILNKHVRLKKIKGTCLSRPDNLIEMLLKLKVKNSYYEVRKRFKDNDPEAKGNVSREALFRIIVTILNRAVSMSLFNRLMDRLGFKDRQIINYGEFFALFRDQSDSDYPKWMDPVNRPYQDKALMNAGEVHNQLREKARQRFLDLADLIPQINPGGNGRILKTEFRQLLNKLMFYMDDQEFNKLWKKYDVNNTGTINGEQFLNKLGIVLKESMMNNGNNGMLSPISEIGGEVIEVLGAPALIKIVTSSKAWSEALFSVYDYHKFIDFECAHSCNNGSEYCIFIECCHVSFDDFVDVLAQYGLSLEKRYLAAFLNRVGVTPVREGVPYREFLHRFQDRSDNGMTHTILTSNKHKSIDKLGTNVISQEEFRAAIESKFNFHLQDDQFECFIDRVPLDEDGNVRYAEFMQQFDTKGMAPSLFQEQPKVRPAPQLLPTDSPAPPPAPPTPIMEEPIPDPGPLAEMTFDDGNHMRRSPQELFKVIKDLLNRKFQDVERMFYELDEINSNRMSQEMMYELLKRFDIHPEITRGEIRDLWKTFITNTDKTLDYHQFVRHFGFSMKSAAFPNAKVQPPRKGDSDFMIRSRKLNCAGDMLMDNLRAKVDYMWEDLRKEFVGMDPYGTGFVSKEEFRDVLTELCVHLSDVEINLLCQKFELRNDGRISYIEFLKPFALRKQIWRHGNNMLSLLQHPQSELPITDIVEPPQKGLAGITAKLRQKLAGDWKNLRRAFKKLDTMNVGYLSVPGIPVCPEVGQCDAR